MKNLGIYQLVNKINGKIYIGKSIDLLSRIRSHKYSKQNFYICRAIRKYGVMQNRHVYFLVDERTLVLVKSIRDILHLKEIAC